MYVPQYLWQCTQTPNHIDLIERRRLQQQEEGEEPEERSVRRRLHGGGGMLEEQYTSGRLLGGGTAINGEQYVWPTRQLLQSIQNTAGGDPDWSPDQVYSILKVRRPCILSLENLRLVLWS